ncbi:MAG: hypothetical protein LC624_12435 [Halobacteriales archaeon]|nr:hypothetical protein [Halobacteriales archaeon]
MPMRFTTEPCPDEQAFRFQNGARAHSLEELRRNILSAPPEVVLFHREHYQHWVRDILQDKPLAERVQQEGQRANSGEQLKRALDPILAQPLQQQGQGQSGGVFGRKR